MGYTVYGDLRIIDPKPYSIYFRVAIVMLEEWIPRRIPARSGFGFRVYIFMFHPYRGKQFLVFGLSLDPPIRFL